MARQSIIPIQSMQYAFWDIDSTKLDAERSRDFIIARVFDRGKLEDVLKVVAYYGEDVSVRALTSNKYLPRDAMYLGHALLAIPLQDFKAYALQKH